MSIDIGTAIAYLKLDRNGFTEGIKSAGEELKGAFTGTGEAGGRLKSLGNSLSSAGSTLTKSLTVPIVGAGAACVKLASDFETGMAKINTIAGAGKKELEGMRKEILKTSSDVGMSAKDFTEATYEALSSGIDKADAVAFTKDSAKLAKAGFTDVTTATDVLTSTINAYGKNAKEATDISNQLIVAQNLGKVTVDQMGASLGNVIPIASALGVKTEELFSSIAVATSQGMKPAESITGLKAAMSNIVKPSDQAKKAAEALGLQFEVNAVKSKGWMGFLQDVKSKLENSAPAYAKKLDEVNKLKKAIETSTQSGKKYNEEIEKEREKITKLREEKKALTSKDGERKKAIDNEIKSMQEHIKTMQKQSKAEKEGAGNVSAMKKELRGKEKELKILEGTSKDTLSAFSTMFGSVEGLNTIMSLTSNTGFDLYNKSMDEMKNNTTAVQEAFNTMMDTPEEKFNKAKEQLKNLGITIGGYLLPHVVRIVDGFSKVIAIIDKLPDPIKKSIVNFAGMVALAGPILKFGGSVAKMGGTVVKGVSKIKDVPKIIKGAAKGIGKAVGGITKAFKLIPKAAGIFKLLPALITPHTLIIVAAIAGIGIVAYQVIKHWDDIKKAAKSLWQSIKDICNKIGYVFKQAIKGWKIAWNDFKDFICGIGEWICDGLLGGLKKGWNKVKDFVGDMAKGIKNTFKKILGIASPSRVFRAYGGFIGAGLIEGINGQEEPINSKFKGLANKIKGLGNVKPRFDLGIDGMAISGDTGLLQKSMKFEQTVNMYLTIPNADKEGAETIARQFKIPVEAGLKDSMTELFMKDVLRD